MIFQNPTYLWGLLGLLIPIAIHLWSRKEGKTIKVGSIKLLTEADSNRSSSISINEIALLLFRMAIIGLLVIILAEPITKENSTRTQVSYLIEPELLEETDVSNLIDSIAEIAPIRLLQPGLPVWESGDDLDSSESMETNYWQLTSEMEELRNDSLIIFTKGYAQNIAGHRPDYTIPTKWIVLNNDLTTSEVIGVLRKDDMIRVISSESNSDILNLSTQEVSDKNFKFNASKDSIQLSVNGKNRWFPVVEPTKLKVRLLADSDFAQEKYYLEAALNAISKITWTDIEIENEVSDQDIDLVIPLNASEVSNGDFKTLVYSHNSLKGELIVEGHAPNEYYLTQRLNSENVLKQHLVEELMELLDVRKAFIPKIEKVDKRVIDSELLRGNIQPRKEERIISKAESMSKWFWYPLLFLLLFERILAYFRKQ